MLPVSARNGKSTDFIDSLFTATSATCVTGLVTKDTYTHWTLFGQIVIITLIQIGGIGVMSIATLISMLLGRTITLKERLIMIEALNQEDLTGIVRLTKHILLGTFIFEGAGAVLLATQFIPDFGIGDGIYKSIFHSIAAFCNAGFDLMGKYKQFNSLVDYVDNPVVNLTIMSLIIIGGLGFAVWEDVLSRIRKRQKLKLHTKLVLLVTAILLVGGFFGFFILEYNNPATMGNMTLSQRLLASAFQSVTPRTAGFNTIPIGAMTPASKFLTIILMFIGAAPGSTGGGIKVTTIAVLVVLVLSIFKGEETPQVMERTISDSTVKRSVTTFFVALSVAMAAMFILSIFEPWPFIDIALEVFSALGTVGLTAGMTPTLTAVSKITLIILMFFGRVGVLSIGIALMTRRNKRAQFRNPEGKVMIG